MTFVHGNNIEQKESRDKGKYSDEKSKQYLSEIRKKYNEWKQGNLELVGPKSSELESDGKIINRRVSMLNQYKDFIDQKKFAEQFDSRSNLHSTVLEEFLYYLFKDVVQDISKNALIGKSSAFKDIFFRPSSFSSMTSTISSKVEKKDHDFSIGVVVSSSLECQGSKTQETDKWHVPAVAIECKTYFDKTMLQDASTAAEQLKSKNPNAIYVVVAEWLKLTNDVNLRKYKIDQVFILRKQKNTDRDLRYEPSYNKNPIHSDVVEYLFYMIREHLTSEWESGIPEGIERGYLI